MEEIFLESAKKNMTTFNLDLFKKTHPKLYFTIIDSMVSINNKNRESLKSKILSSIPTPEMLKIESEKLDSLSEKKFFVKGADFVLENILNSFKNG